VDSKATHLPNFPYIHRSLVAKEFLYLCIQSHTLIDRCRNSIYTQDKETNVSHLATDRLPSNRSPDKFTVNVFLVNYSKMWQRRVRQM